MHIPSRSLMLASLAALLSACSGSAGRSDSGDDLEPPIADAGKDAGLHNDAGPTDAGMDAGMMPVDSGFVPAPHEEDQVPDMGGPTIATPTLVTITYADLPQRSYVEAFGAWIVQSNWLQQAGNDYGVGLGTQVKGELTDNAPVSINYEDIPTYIVSQMNSGTLPAPTGVPGSYIYEIYYPSTTDILIQGQSLCASSGGGYHDEAAGPAGEFPYAVVTDCTSNPGSTTMTNFTTGAAHEFIEASTDPLPESNPGYFQGTTSSDPWSQVGGEVGDMCAFAPTLVLNGYTVPPVWSNSASKAGGAPCVPVGQPYFNVSASPGTMQPVAAGASFTFTLTGWSSAPVPDWALYAAAEPAYYEYTPFTPTTTLGTTAGMNNGQTTTLIVGVPAGTPSGSGTLVYIGSYTSDSDDVGQVVGVYVP